MSLSWINVQSAPFQRYVGIHAFGCFIIVACTQWLLVGCCRGGCLQKMRKLWTYFTSWYRPVAEAEIGNRLAGLGPEPEVIFTLEYRFTSQSITTRLKSSPVSGSLWGFDFDVDHTTEVSCLLSLHHVINKCNGRATNCTCKFMLLRHLLRQASCPLIREVQFSHFVFSFLSRTTTADSSDGAPQSWRHTTLSKNAHPFPTACAATRHDSGKWRWRITE